MTTTAVATTAKPTRRWRSNLRHGLRSRKLPFAGGRSIEKHRNVYRRAIEDELLSQGREIGVLEATHVAAAAAAYEHALKAGFWLANHHDALNHDQRLAFSREEVRGFSEAAKLLKQLGVERDARSQDIWAALHSHGDSAMRAARGAAEAIVVDADNAAAGRVGGDNDG